MPSVQSPTPTPDAPVFDHGAALRVPPAHDVRNWRRLEAWLGDQGMAEIEAGLVRVFTSLGEQVAHSGDWIVLSVRGEYHVARGERPAYHA